PSSAQPGAAGRQSPAPAGGVAPTPVHWDDSWFGRLTAKHKAVFDSPQIEDGFALGHASGYIRGMQDVTGASSTEVQTVVVIRHAAVPMILNDAMWEKYGIGEERKIKTSGGGDKWATRNEYIGTAPSSERPAGTLTWLLSHGHTVLGCDQATRG